MSEPFIAEIRIFAGNYAPRGWAFCDGRLLPISQNTALFSLVGTNYGGDGETTFGLPNLQGRAPMHAGRGPGLTARRLGQWGGSETVTLTESQMPNHNHPVSVLAMPATTGTPSQTTALAVADADTYGPATDLEPMAEEQIGGSQLHNNLQPYLAMNFIIALVGMYPSRD